MEGKNTEKEVEIVVRLKHLSSFWRTLDMPLTNCKINLILTRSENFVLTSKATRNAVPVQGGNPAVSKINNPTNAIFQITEAKLYVPVVTLSTENDKKLLEQLRTGFKKTIKWNKYKSEITKVNRLFVLSFENEDDKTSYSKYYVPNVQIKDLMC